MPDDDWPEDTAQRGVILADFATNSRYGDRCVVSSIIGPASHWLHAACGIEALLAVARNVAC